MSGIRFSALAKQKSAVLQKKYAGKYYVDERMSDLVEYHYIRGFSSLENGDIYFHSFRFFAPQKHYRAQADPYYIENVYALRYLKRISEKRFLKAYRDWLDYVWFERDKGAKK